MRHVGSHSDLNVSQSEALGFIIIWKRTRAKLLFFLWFERVPVPDLSWFESLPVKYCVFIVFWLYPRAKFVFLFDLAVSQCQMYVLLSDSKAHQCQTFIFLVMWKYPHAKLMFSYGFESLPMPNCCFPNDLKSTQCKHSSAKLLRCYVQGVQFKV